MSDHATTFPVILTYKIFICCPENKCLTCYVWIILSIIIYQWDVDNGSRLVSVVNFALYFHRPVLWCLMLFGAVCTMQIMLQFFFSCLLKSFPFWVVLYFGSKFCSLDIESFLFGVEAVITLCWHSIILYYCAFYV